MALRSDTSRFLFFKKDVKEKNLKDFNAATAGMSNSDKAYFYKNSDFAGSDYVKYKLQESLGELIDSVLQRRDDAIKRDELRKRMLGTATPFEEDKNAIIKRSFLG